MTQLFRTGERGQRTRRTFLKGLGVSSAAVGFASAGAVARASHRRNATAMQSQTTVQVAAPSWLVERQGELNSVLRDDGGLSSSIQVEFDDEAHAGNTLAKYRQWLNAGRASPAVMVMDNPLPPVFIDEEQLEPIDPLFAESLTNRIQKEYFSSMVSTVTDDGTLYGLPLFVDIPTIQYRKDALRQAGFTDSEFRGWSNSSMNWQQFSDVIKAGIEASGLDGFLWQGDAYEGLACCDFLEFMSSWGGSYFGGFENLFGPVGNRPITVDEQPVVDALRMLRTFIYGPSDNAALDGYAAISPEAVVDYTEEPSRRVFTDGGAVALRNWPYSININGAEDRFGDDLGVMPIPYGVSRTGSKYGPEIGGIPAALGGSHLTVNPNAPVAKREAAAEVLTAFHTRPVRLYLFESLGLVSPESTDLMLGDFREVEPLGRYADSLLTAGENLVPRPATRVWPSQSSAIATEVNDALRQHKEPERAMNDLKRRLREIEESVLSSTPTATQTADDSRSDSTETGSSGTTATAGSTETSTGGQAADAANEGTSRTGTSRESAPGFGVVAALAGIGVLAWRQGRRN